ncbi:MAG: VWA domain-containing protein, partial [Actinomycetota bacterium]|nr:VWA domain-containing protein [Actinomycetota bacterium]
MRRVLVVFVALVLGALPALAQTASPEVEIVDINGSRYPEGGQTQMVIEFRNLDEAPDPADVGITVNGEAVSDLVVEPVGDSTVAVGVVMAIDASGSMAGGPIEAAKTAAKDFVSQARASDRIALITFADEVLVLSGFTNSKQVLNDLIDGIEANGETAFNDAVVKGVELYSSVSARDLLAHMIVLTDGEDTVSVATIEEAVAAVATSDVRVFGVALESPDFNPDPVEQVATAGNGLFLSTPDPEQLSTLYEEISREISNTMVAKFVSPIAVPGDAEFVVSYLSFTASTTFAVSGYATTTTAATGPTTTETLAPLITTVVESSAPLDRGTLLLIGSVGLGLTLFLFLVILFGREDEDDPGRFAKRLQAYGRKGRPDEEKRPLLQRLPLLSRFSEAAEEEVKKRGLFSGMNSALEQANIPMTPGEAILAMVGLSTVAGIIAAIFNGLIVGLIVFGGMLLLMFGFVQFAGSREKRLFENQLPDTLTLMSTSLRAGYSLLQATEAVASEAQNPTAREFGRALTEARLG